MNPAQEEAIDLKKNPLPISSEDRVLPTLIFNYDEQINRLEIQLDTLRAERRESLERAIKLGCMQDKQYVIEKKEKEGDRVADAALLKSRLPILFKKYVDLRIEQIKVDHEMKKAKEIGEVEEKIKLGVADKVFGKNNVDACSSKMVTVQYVVKRVEEK